MMPKDAPSVLRMRTVLRQWSHCTFARQHGSGWKRLIRFSRMELARTFSLSRASLMGLLVRLTGAGGVFVDVESAMIAYENCALSVPRSRSRVFSMDVKAGISGELAGITRSRDAWTMSGIKKFGLQCSS